MTNFVSNTKYGYYKIQNTQTVLYHENKFRAIEIATKINGWIEWVFHDDVFSSYDWSIEPQESITDLYAQRARQLREKYDHLVLMYSGGYDSHNIFRTFVDNDIRLDEVCFMYSEYDYIADSSINLEWRVQTKPKIEHLLKYRNDIYFRRLNIGPAILDTINNIAEDYIYLNNSLAPNHRVWNVIYKYVDTWGNLINQGKKIAIIFGHDKPQMRYCNGQWIYNFYDSGLFPRISDSTEMSVEWFYWSPDIPLLPIKQAHIVKKFWLPKKDILVNYKAIQNKNLGWVLNTRNDDVQQLVYPLCQNGQYLTWPPVQQGMGGTRDIWVYQGNSEKNQKLTQLYQHTKCMFDSRYFNNSNFDNGFILHISPDYIV